MEGDGGRGAGQESHVSERRERDKAKEMIISWIVEMILRGVNLWSRGGMGVTLKFPGLA